MVFIAASAGTTKEDVLESSKKQTAFKTQHYSTTNTRSCESVSS